MRGILLSLFLFGVTFVVAQKIDSIYINLYTDSLKIGSFNYINIDGRLSNGKYVPLDSTDLIFWASDGKFYGNQLMIDRNFSKDRVSIKVVLRQNTAVNKEFIMFIKKKPDEERLPTAEEILIEKRSKKKKKK